MILRVAVRGAPEGRSVSLGEPSRPPLRRRLHRNHRRFAHDTALLSSSARSARADLGMEETSNKPATTRSSSPVASGFTARWSTTNSGRYGVAAAARVEHINSHADGSSRLDGASADSGRPATSTREGRTAVRRRGIELAREVSEAMAHASAAARRPATAVRARSKPERATVPPPWKRWPSPRRRRPCGRGAGDAAASLDRARGEGENLSLSSIYTILHDMLSRLRWRRWRRRA